MAVVGMACGGRGLVAWDGLCAAWTIEGGGRWGDGETGGRGIWPGGGSGRGKPVVRSGEGGRAIPRDPNG